MSIVTYDNGIPKVAMTERQALVQAAREKGERALRMAEAEERMSDADRNEFRKQRELRSTTFQPFAFGGAFVTKLPSLDPRA